MPSLSHVCLTMYLSNHQVRSKNKTTKHLDGNISMDLTLLADGLAVTENNYLVSTFPSHNWRYYTKFTHGDNRKAAISVKVQFLYQVFLSAEGDYIFSVGAKISADFCLNPSYTISAPGNSRKLSENTLMKISTNPLKFRIENGSGKIWQKSWKWPSENSTKSWK